MKHIGLTENFCANVQKGQLCFDTPLRELPAHYEAVRIETKGLAEFKHLHFMYYL
jgi:hypothetical protein